MRRLFKVKQKVISTHTLLGKVFCRMWHETMGVTIPFRASIRTLVGSREPGVQWSPIQEVGLLSESRPKRPGLNRSHPGRAMSSCVPQRNKKLPVRVMGSGRRDSSGQGLGKGNKGLTGTPQAVEQDGELAGHSYDRPFLIALAGASQFETPAA